MGNPTFFTTYAPTAQKCSAATGVFTSVILAQWAIETDYGSELNGSLGYGTWNFGNVSPNGSVASYPNRTAGLQAYIQNLNSSYYTAVRTAATWEGQAKALGASPWAAGHYNTPTTGGYPGSQIIAVVNDYQLTKYDNGVGGTSHATTVSPTTGVATNYAYFQATFLKAYGAVAPPPKGFGSTASSGDFVINGATLSELVGDCTVTVEPVLSITKASSITLTIHDPTRQVINSAVFSAQATMTLGTTTWIYQGMEKSGSVLTITFIPWVVYALEQQTGPFTVAPGRLTRSQFAQMLVSQIEGSTFWQATPTYLASLKQEYAHTARVQMSRGTINAPLENSWTCLQRLAAEVQWICFEVYGTVYFGPYNYLTTQHPALTPKEFKNGITTITGTFTTGQPTGDLTITCVADSWTPTPGQCVAITTLGPFNGNWIVSELSRQDIEEPTITVTCIQPQPGLPEPISGNTVPAIGSGSGSFQTTGGRRIAQAAVAFALSKVGKAYSETPGKRLGPTSYDCSGLVYEAYMSAGKSIGGPNHTTFTMWPNAAGTHVPAGVANLEIGDLLWFGYLPYSTNEQAQHVAMVVSVTAKRGTIKIVQAASPAQGIITTSNINPTIEVSYGTLVYLGATRPAP